MYTTLAFLKQNEACRDGYGKLASFYGIGASVKEQRISLPEILLISGKEDAEWALAHSFIVDPAEFEKVHRRLLPKVWSALMHHHGVYSGVRDHLRVSRAKGTARGRHSFNYQRMQKAAYASLYEEIVEVLHDLTHVSTRDTNFSWADDIYELHLLEPISFIAAVFDRYSDWNVIDLKWDESGPSAKAGLPFLRQFSRPDVHDGTDAFLLASAFTDPDVNPYDFVRTRRWTLPKGSSREGDVVVLRIDLTTQPALILAIAQYARGHLSEETLAQLRETAFAPDLRNEEPPAQPAPRQPRRSVPTLVHPVTSEAPALDEPVRVPAVEMAGNGS